jgi:hypothetical protein
MKAKHCFILAIVCLLLISGCYKKAIKQVGGKDEVLAFLTEPSPPPSSGRFIAVSHHLVVEIPESDLVKVWESSIKLCQTLKCEVLNSSITGQAANATPEAELSLRVMPDDLDKLFGHIRRTSTIVEHKTESEDKTAQVIDTEAKLKNMTELRDRLRTLLAKAPASVKDLVELEKELANIQSEIDSLTTTRKVLANETEKVSVHISFRPKRTISRTGVFAPVANAWHESGAVLADSLGELITFIFAVLPWLIIIVPTIWIIVRFFRRRSQKRKAASKAE